MDPRFAVTELAMPAPAPAPERATVAERERMRAARGDALDAHAEEPTHRPRHGARPLVPVAKRALPPTATRQQGTSVAEQQRVQEVRERNLRA